jgi:hypothetical protein
VRAVPVGSGQRNPLLDFEGKCCSTSALPRRGRALRPERPAGAQALRAALERYHFSEKLVHGASHAAAVLAASDAVVAGAQLRRAAEEYRWAAVASRARR